MRPTATFARGKAKLYHGDCLKIIRPGMADHAICDPPYEATMHAAKQSRKRKLRTDAGNEPRAIGFASIEAMRPRLVPLLERGVRKWLIAFCTPEGIAPWRDAIESAGIRYKRACFWYKPDAAPQFNGQGPGYAVEPFVTAWCGRGFSKWNGGGGRNLFTHNTNNPERHGENPTEKPLSLMMELIELFTQPGDTILDPCMGTGTTGIACLATGRKFIGIERDQRTFDIAAARFGAWRMGRDEGRRFITRELGDLAAPGPLFGDVT